MYKIKKTTIYKMKTITIKIPIPPQLLNLHLEITRYTEKEALYDFQKIIQLLIDNMLPRIFETLNDTILALETEKTNNK